MTQPQTAQQQATSTWATPPPGSPGGPPAPGAQQAAAAGAADVAHEAKGQASEVAHIAGNELHTAWQGLQHDLRGQASQQAERAGQGLRRVSAQLEALRQGDTEGAGPMLGYAEQLQGRVQGLAQRVEEGGIDGVMADVRTFARRRPVAFLAGAAAAGFLVGRLVRSSSGSGNGANSSPMDGYTSMPTATYRTGSPTTGPAPLTSTGLPSAAPGVPPPPPAPLSETMPPTGMSS
jgi:hypothetical protein